jgi:hypothetical protein
MKRSRYLFLGSLLGALTALAVQHLRRRAARPAASPLQTTEAPQAAPPPTPPAAKRARRTRRTPRLTAAVAVLGLLAAGLATAAYATGWHSGWDGSDGSGSGDSGSWGHHHHHQGPPPATTTEPATTTTTTASTTVATTTAPTTTAPTTTVATTTAPTTTTTTTTSGPTYPWHQNVTSTVFWVGEPQGNGSSEDNSISAYDDAWEQHYGGYDNYTVTRVPPTYANGLGFTPLQNPFYLDLPYDDVNDRTAFADRCQVVPWAAQYPASDCRNGAFSYMKNQWVEIQHTVGSVTYTAYGQIEDAGPYVYDDEAYVFGSSAPQSRQANNAGLDVSPALRDDLNFGGTSASDRLNNDENKVSWRFVDASQVPSGPWTITVTTSQVYQP